MRFQKQIWDFSKANRRDFAWRRTTNPYKILVSEVMLQQTQTDRVANYYSKFLRKFPTLKALSNAALADVLIAWQGLGYNRRARFLWQFARQVVAENQGKMPTTPESLQQLPGIGSYTARALCVFAYNQSHALIETNIRAVYIDCFFKKALAVTDKELLPLIDATIDRGNPREWFYALMDFGSKLKKENRQVNKKSAHYSKQSRFEGSKRQVRGMIVRELTKNPSLSLKDLLARSDREQGQFETILSDLIKEGMIEEARGRFRLRR